MLEANNNQGGEPPMREDLLQKIGVQIETAYRVRDASAYPRASQGDGPLDVVICLGSGRCMFPRLGSETRHCPFCLVAPNGIDARSRAKEITRRFVMGN